MNTMGRPARARCQAQKVSGPVPRKAVAPTSFQCIPDVGKDTCVPFDVDRYSMRWSADCDQRLREITEVGESGLFRRRDLAAAAS